MTFEELIDLLTERKALLVHCSRPGKGDVGAGGLLFPEDLHNAIKICSEQKELSCSLIWPDHVKTFGAVGIILKPRAIGSIKSVSPHDSGTSTDGDGKRQGMGVPFSAQAVKATFANSKNYNEWTVTDADTIGIFINLCEPLLIAKNISITAIPGYHPSMGVMDTIAPVRITIKEVMEAFPNLPLFGFVGTEIVEIGVNAASLYGGRCAGGITTTRLNSIAIGMAMTPTVKWLQAKAPGFKNLSMDEQNTITGFLLLWSLFESRVLNTEGSAKNICAAAETWHEAGTLDADAFDPELAYFRQRYYADGAFTYHFRHLHFRKPDREDLVCAVIDGSDNDPRSRMAANLIIVFRYRNNLFHGVKWQYNLEGQFGNFSAANAILMKVLERHGALAEG